MFKGWVFFRWLFIVLFLVVSTLLSSAASATAACIDTDGDGYGNPGDASCMMGNKPDCNDADPNVYPGASKICDGRDNNCDGIQDFATDIDKDLDGAFLCANDCDDNNANRSPLITEGPFGSATCADGIDNDCDFKIDAGDRGCIVASCIDNDGDGYGSPGHPVCPKGGLEDCNNNDLNVNPDASDISCDGIDNNCSGVKDEGYTPTPASCGIGACARTGQYICQNGTVVNTCTAGIPFPNDASCDNSDNNCNGMTDEGYVPATTTCGLGVCLSAGQNICQSGTVINTCIPNSSQTEGPSGAPTCSDNLDNDCDGLTDAADPHCNSGNADLDSDGYSPNSGDCDDTDPSVYPAASRLCDGKDNNCDGIQDFMTDTDKDADGVPFCGGDCDDNNNKRSPLKAELYGSVECSDGIDNDCDFKTDMTDTGCQNPCADKDADGYGNPGSPFCLNGAATDCNDNNPVIKPGATDTTCNGMDENCSGAADEGYPATGTSCGTGACASTGQNICQSGAIVNTCAPGAPGTEGPYGNATCTDGSDNDCDGTTDTADIDCSAACVDADSDGYGANGSPFCPNGTGVDCNDADPDIHPGVFDAGCNGIDENCSGTADEGYLVSATSCGTGACARAGQSICQSGTVVDTCTPGTPGAEGPYGHATCSDGSDNDCDGTTDGSDLGCTQICLDNDADGYGNPGSPLCAGGSAADCNDNDNTVFPGATRICDGKDNNCDKVKDFATDEDKDKDGVATCANDCDDNNPNRYPGNIEAPSGSPICMDGIDNDCDFRIDSYDTGCKSSCIDTDSDGYGCPAAPACSKGAALDCNCTNPNINPGAQDSNCNGTDENCSGVADEGYMPSQTTCGVGACAAAGQNICQGGAVVNTCIPATAGTEGPNGSATCSDALDNDCDGLTDPADPDCIPPAGCTSDAQCPGATYYCKKAPGDCNGSGTCQLKNACIPGQYNPVCGCDGRTYGDCEALGLGINVSYYGECGVSCIDLDGDAYGSNGSPFCPNGPAVDCNDNNANINPGMTDTSCNGIDENCSGSADEGYVTTPTTCGAGVCSATGQNVCRSGSVVNTCSPGSPQMESYTAAGTCTDGLDNDCDTDTDAFDGGCVTSCMTNADCSTAAYCSKVIGDCFGSGMCMPRNVQCPLVMDPACGCDGITYSNACAGTQAGVSIDYSGQCTPPCIDGDSDGYGANGHVTCPNGTAIDCNDTDPAIKPGTPENCSDGVDNNCNRRIDAGDSDCGATFNMFDLGTLGGDYSSAEGINSFGDVVGSSKNISGDIHAFLYKDGSMTDLGAIGNGSGAHDINNSGKIAGYTMADIGGGGYSAHPMLYENGTMIDPGIGPGHAFGINEARQIVGSLSVAGGGGMAFLYENGTVTDLGSLGGNYSTAYDINSTGQIVGYSKTAGGDFHAFLYENGAMRDLGTLGGLISYAHSINNSGQIVGYSQNADGYNRAFLYENGVMTDLGTLGGNSSFANGINNNGQIVGYSATLTETHAFLYENGVMKDIGTLGGSWSRAEDINDNGEIAGRSFSPDGTEHAFIWKRVVSVLDADGDGYMSDVDCNDADAGIHPAALDNNCNGIDENCSGTADEGFVATSTACGAGVCSATGQNICQGGAIVDTCTAGSPTGTDTNCNGVDENCSGAADEGYVPTQTTCGVGACAAAGQNICQGGTVVDTCTSGSPTGMDDNCNGLDENCNGTADEYYSSTATACGTGACSTAGQLICQAGAIVDTCISGTPLSESYTVTGTCGDGTDNDCDGTTDLADSDCAIAAPHNNQTCITCHTTPDTYVANANIPDSACQACHASGATGSSLKVDRHYSQNYIDPATGLFTDIRCVECHNPMSIQTNLKLIRSIIRSRPVVFTAFTGVNSFADGGAPYDGICEVCHTQTNYHQGDGTSPGGQSHNDGSMCTACHFHDAGFNAQNNCLLCHNGPTGTGRRQIVEAAAGDGSGDFSRASHHVVNGQASSQVVNQDACIVCHDQANHMTYGDGVSALLKDQDSGASVAFNGSGSSAEGFCVSCHDANGSTLYGTAPFNQSGSGDTGSPVNIAWTTGVMSHSIDQACFNCHGDESGGNAHGSQNAKILKQNNYLPSASQAFCNTCHNGTGAAKNIEALFARPYPHGSRDCQSCHDQHNAQSGTHADVNQWYPNIVNADTNNVSKVISGVTGAEPSWPAIWTAPASFTAQETAAKEYQICLKCHSNNNEGGTPPGTSTDQALEFNPNNKSAHPVSVTLNNQAGAVSPRSLQAGQMTEPWTAVGNQTMMCSDCHGANAENAGDPKGPHGSAARYMLKGAGTFWPYKSDGTTMWRLNTTDAQNTQLFCKNCHPIYSSGSWKNNVHSRSYHASNGFTIGGQSGIGLPCVACHTAVPHGSKRSRLITYSSDASPYNYNNVNRLSGFRKASTPAAYSRSNCYSTVSGCTTHTASVSYDQ